MNDETVYDFAWNATKAISNIGKHGVTFDDAATIFRDAFALTVFDANHSQSEERWFTLGFDRNGLLLAVAHTFQIVTTNNVRIRIISARKATPREREFYENEPR